MPQREPFRYFNSISSKDGKTEQDVKHIIKAIWLKGRHASGVLCDQHPTRYNRKLQRIDDINQISYDPECWKLESNTCQKGVQEWRECLDGCVGKLEKIRVRNEHIRKHIQVASIGDKLKKTRLRWF